MQTRNPQTFNKAWKRTREQDINTVSSFLMLFKRPLPDFTRFFLNINENALFLVPLCGALAGLLEPKQAVHFALDFHRHSASLPAVSTDAPASCCYRLLLKDIIFWKSTRFVTSFLK